MNDCKEIKPIVTLQMNLSKHIILYTVTSIILGIMAGYYFNIKAGWLILPLVFLMVYPMMTDISTASLRRIRCAKPLCEALLINFVISPILMYGLSGVFVKDQKIRLGLMMLAVAPSSSMGLGFIGLSRGDIAAGAAIVATAFLLSIVVYPLAGSYFAGRTNFSVPTFIIFKNLVLILILPLILGILTREIITRRKGDFCFKIRYKPVFSTITLLCLYVLIFAIFSSKAKLIVGNGGALLAIIPVAIIFYPLLILLTLVVNRKFGFSYEQHQSVVFTSVSKNVALSIAILVTAFGKYGQYMAVAPAIMALFQAPMLMTYLKLSERVRTFFS